MAVDTRLKRQSATCMLVPSMLSSVFPDTSGVVQAEWQAVAWMYSGITAAVAVEEGAARQPKIFRYRDEEDILFLISRFIQVVEGPLN